MSESKPQERKDEKPLPHPTEDGELCNLDRKVEELPAVSRSSHYS